MSKEKGLEEKKDDAIDKIVDLIGAMAPMVAQHGPPVLQEAWNNIIRKLNEIISGLDLVQSFLGERGAGESPRGSPNGGRSVAHS